MPLTRLQHFLVRADDLEATKDFYVEVLGFKVGKRPPFAFSGYWLYLGRDAFIHLAGPAADAAKTPRSRGTGRSAGTGALDHIAFEGTNYAAMLTKLKRLGIALTLRTVPDQGLRQIFINDPNGVTLELNFAAASPNRPRRSATKRPGAHRARRGD